MDILELNTRSSFEETTVLDLYVQKFLRNSCSKEHWRSSRNRKYHFCRH